MSTVKYEIFSGAGRHVPQKEGDDCLPLLFWTDNIQKLVFLIEINQIMENQALLSLHIGERCRRCGVLWCFALMLASFSQK